MLFCPGCLNLSLISPHSHAACHLVLCFVSSAVADLWPQFTLPTSPRWADSLLWLRSALAPTIQKMARSRTQLTSRLPRFSHSERCFCMRKLFSTVKAFSHSARFPPACESTYCSGPTLPTAQIVFACTQGTGCNVISANGGAGSLLILHRVSCLVPTFTPDSQQIEDSQLPTGPRSLRRLIC